MDRTRGQASVPTIRSQLTRIVLIPGISFLVLWAIMTAAGTWQAGTLMLAVADGRDGVAALGSLTAEMREERRLSQLRLGDPGDEEARTALKRQRDTADTALKKVERLLPSLRSGSTDEIRRSADAFLGAVEELPAIRSSVDEAEIERADALAAHTELIEKAELLTASLLRPMSQGEAGSEAALSHTLLTAREEYAQADALLAGAIAEGAMDYEETAHFTYLTASYRRAISSVAPELRGSTQEHYETLVSSTPWVATQRLSREVVTRPPVRSARTSEDSAEWNSEISVTADEWEKAVQSAVPALDDVVAVQMESAIRTSWEAALGRIAVSVAGCVLTLVAGTAAIIIANRSSRRLTERLRRLRSQTLALSESRLPAIVNRAQSGRRVDLAEELPRLSYGRDEIGQVADAFNIAQRTAVGAAVKQAEIREGANRVFLSIAYRNQALVQRQLRLLDEIEYDEEDPETLRKLFRLDHLATRARRYAGNLLILSGARSSRRWRDPLLLVDVLRAAISETEDYERVRLTSAARVRVRGTAVADVVHLIAELVENAAQFSPSDAAVDLNCGTVAGGVAVDVEDRGLGMTEEGYAAAGRVLAEAPEFDVMALPDEPRLGLFVVARLAARHGVKVRLCPSPYGGTRATAILPEELLEYEPREEQDAPVPARMAASRPDGAHEPVESSVDG